MGLIVENSEPGTSSDYLTPPEGEAEVGTSGAEANTEEAVEDLLQDKLNSPMEETEGYSVDPWPEVDWALEEVFNQEYEDLREAEGITRTDLWTKSQAGESGQESDNDNPPELCHFWRNEQIWEELVCHVTRG